MLTWELIEYPVGFIAGIVAVILGPGGRDQGPFSWLILVRLSWILPLQ